MAFLDLQGVRQGFGSGTRRTEVLRDIHLGIDEGEFVAIVGSSGSGKTTLMSLLAGLRMPDEGRITLRGEPVTGPSPERALVFQNYSLLPWLSVFENIALAVDAVFPQWTRARRRAHVDAHVERVNLSAARDRRPRELSGGMRQRVSVARALAMEPKVLLLDEPLSALDALTRATLQDELARLCSASGRTVVLITNDVDEGLLLADRIVPLILSDGSGATLGPAVRVELERPRDRRALNHDPQFTATRKHVIEGLLGAARRPRTPKTHKLVLPEIEPEDLNRPYSLFGRPRPRRRAEEHTETVSADS